MNVKRMLTLVLALVLCMGLLVPVASAAVQPGEVTVTTTMDGYPGFVVTNAKPFFMMYENDNVEMRNGYGIIGENTVITVMNNTNQFDRIVFCTLIAFSEEKGVTVKADDAVVDNLVYRAKADAHMTADGSFYKGTLTLDQSDPNAAKLMIIGETVQFKGRDLQKVYPKADLFMLNVYIYDLSEDQYYSNNYIYEIDSEKAQYVIEGKNPEDPENPFTDVPRDSYCRDAVLWALEKNITTGMTETTFAPKSTCTRGQVATFLWRANGCPEPETTENPFTDVKEIDYYYKPILWAYENGITTGTTETTFSPNGTCTSAHVITFLWRANGEPAAKTEGTEYYAQAVAWAIKKKLLEGTDMVFAPDNLSPRGDIVTYLYRNAK